MLVLVLVLVLVMVMVLALVLALVLVLVLVLARRPAPGSGRHRTPRPQLYSGNKAALNHVSTHGLGRDHELVPAKNCSKCFCSCCCR